MPIIKSARKRVKQTTKANLRNTRTKRAMREAIKAYERAVASGKSANVMSVQQKAVSAIDIAAKKHVIHKNKAARLKSAMAVKAKTAGVKPTKKAAAKPTAKKSTPKTPKKKPAAKKK